MNPRLIAKLARCGLPMPERVPVQPEPLEDEPEDVQRYVAETTKDLEPSE